MSLCWTTHGGLQSLCNDGHLATRGVLHPEAASLRSCSFHALSFINFLCTLHNNISCVIRLVRCSMLDNNQYCTVYRRTIISPVHSSFYQPLLRSRSVSRETRSCLCPLTSARGRQRQILRSTTTRTIASPTSPTKLQGWSDGQVINQPTLDT